MFGYPCAFSVNSLIDHGSNARLVRSNILHNIAHMAQMEIGTANICIPHNIIGSLYFNASMFIYETKVARLEPLLSGNINTMKNTTAHTPIVNFDSNKRINIIPLAYAILLKETFKFNPRNNVKITSVAVERSTETPKSLIFALKKSVNNRTEQYITAGMQINKLIGFE